MPTGPARESDGADASARRVRDAARFEQLLEDSDRVLVEFYADWCGPCRSMASTVDALAAESAADVVKVDVEAIPQLTARYDVTSIPTFLAFETGTVRERLVGMQSKEMLRQAIE